MTGRIECRRRLHWRAGLQSAYVVLFALGVLWPNLVARPSLLLVASAALAAIWLLGCAGLVARMPRADELMLCGAFAPVIVGLTQWVYRVNFLLTHQGLTRAEGVGESAGAFVLVWALETVLVLLPGLVFAVWNARSLSPLDESLGQSQSTPRRPASRRKRT